MSSIYERVGGEPAIEAAVEVFYKKVLSDQRIRHHFSTADMPKQLAKQKGFFRVLFKGNADNAAGYMRNAHKHLTLTEADFGAVAEHLQATLQELGVPADLTGEIMGAAASMMNDVLNR